MDNTRASLIAIDCVSSGADALVIMQYTIQANMLVNNLYTLILKYTIAWIGLTKVREVTVVH